MPVFDLLVEHPENFVKSDLVEHICKYLGEDMETETADVYNMIKCADYCIILRQWTHTKSLLGDVDETA